MIIKSQRLAEICRVFEFSISLRSFADEFHDSELEMFDDLGLSILDKLEAIVFQNGLDSVDREVLTCSCHDHLTERDTPNIKVHPCQLFAHHSDASIANHVLYKERRSGYLFVFLHWFRRFGHHAFIFDRIR